MKRVLLYTMLFTYTGIMLKPAMPYFADAAAHLLWYESHAISVHSHHGKSHAHFEAAEEAKKNNSREEMGKKTETSNEHIINSRFYLFMPVVQIQQQYAAYQSILPSKEAAIDIPPPRI
jgi:hypothetical protein